MFNKNKSWLIPVFGALAVIVCAAAFLMYKLGQKSGEDKWSDYDDYGWS